MTTLTSIPSLPARQAGASLPARALSLAYSSAVYVCFLATFVYVIGFLSSLLVPKAIDDGTVVGLTESLLVNGGFLALFAVQHMVMARPAFKRRWTRIVPAHVERSTFVLATCAILIAMVWQWRPMPGVVWHVEGAWAAVLWTTSAVGWGTVLLATFLIDHFELFGVRQSVRYALGRPSAAPHFVERSLYRFVRHPLMTGFLLAFWATPHMTLGHLFFTVMCTGYILIGTRVEERDLIATHGEAYLDYKRRVPGLVPFSRRGR